MRVYRKGQISTSNGHYDVWGQNGTLFTPFVSGGDLINIDGRLYEISEVLADNHLVLAEPSRVTASYIDYYIIPIIANRHTDELASLMVQAQRKSIPCRKDVMGWIRGNDTDVYPLSRFTGGSTNVDSPAKIEKNLTFDVAGAQASETSSLLSKTNAEQYEADATASETNAAASDANATASAASAQSSETIASDSAAMAEKYADELEDIEVSPLEYSAFHHAMKTFEALGAQKTKVTAADTTPGTLQEKINVTGAQVEVVSGALGEVMNLTATHAGIAGTSEPDLHPIGAVRTLQTILDQLSASVETLQIGVTALEIEFGVGETVEIGQVVGK